MTQADVLEPYPEQTIAGVANEIMREILRAPERERRVIAKLNVNGWDKEAARRGREAARNLDKRKRI